MVVGRQIKASYFSGLHSRWHLISTERSSSPPGPDADKSGPTSSHSRRSVNWLIQNSPPLADASISAQPLPEFSLRQERKLPRAGKTGNGRGAEPAVSWPYALTTVRDSGTVIARRYGEAGKLKRFTFEVFMLSSGRSPPQTSPGPTLLSSNKWRALNQVETWLLNRMMFFSEAQLRHVGR